MNYYEVFLPSMMKKIWITWLIILKLGTSHFPNTFEKIVKA